MPGSRTRPSGDLVDASAPLYRSIFYWSLVGSSGGHSDGRAIEGVESRLIGVFPFLDLLSLCVEFRRRFEHTVRHGDPPRVHIVMFLHWDLGYRRCHLDFLRYDGHKIADTVRVIEIIPSKTGGWKNMVITPPLASRL